MYGMDEPVTLYRRHWTVTNTVKRLKCGKTWRKGDVVVSACVKGNAAYVMIAAPNRYWPAHGKYMYTYMEAPRSMFDLLIDRLHGIGEELGVSMKDVASYLFDRMLAKKKQKSSV
jgi:hypothetical protein